MTQYVSRAGDPSLYLTNTQTATKIDIFEYNGTEPGKYSNTSQPLPSQYQFLNIWNFSTFRIRIVDREGRTLAEVPQKSTNYFNSRIGAPSSDLYFTIYWEQDYTAEGMENFNIEGSYFRVVGSDVPLLEPTSLLADMLAIQQGDNIQHIVDEGIMVESKVPYPSRFTFTEGEELEDLSGQFYGEFNFIQQTTPHAPTYPNNLHFFHRNNAFGTPLSYTSDGPIPWTGSGTEQDPHLPQWVNNMFYYTAQDLALATIYQLYLQAFNGNNSSWEEIFLNLEKMKAQIENTIEIKGADIWAECASLHEPAQNLFDINAFFTGDFNFGGESINNGNGNDENLVLLPKIVNTTTNTTRLKGKDMINTTRWRRTPIVGDTLTQPIFYMMQCSTNNVAYDALKFSSITNNLLFNGYGYCNWFCTPNIILSAKKQRDYMPIFYKKALEYYANNDLTGYNNYILGYLNNRFNFFDDIIQVEYDTHSGFWQTLANNYMARFIYDENHFNPQKQTFGIQPSDGVYWISWIDVGVLNGEVYIKYAYHNDIIDQPDDRRIVQPLMTNKKYNTLYVNSQNFVNTFLPDMHNPPLSPTLTAKLCQVRNELRNIKNQSSAFNNIMYPSTLKLPLEKLDGHYSINFDYNSSPAISIRPMSNSNFYIIGEDYYKEV